MRRPSDGAIKIGVTAGNAYWRLREVSSAMREDVELLGVLEGDRRLEQSIHARFYASRIRTRGFHTEWFRPDEPILTFVRAYCALPPRPEPSPVPEASPPIGRAELAKVRAEITREWRRAK